MKNKIIHRFFLDENVKDNDILNFWVLSYNEGKKENAYENTEKIKPGFFLRWAEFEKNLKLQDLKDFSSHNNHNYKPPQGMENIYFYLREGYFRKRNKSSLFTAMRYSLELYEKYSGIHRKLPLSDLLRLWGYFVQTFNEAMSDGVRKHVDTIYRSIVNSRLPNAEKQLKQYVSNSFNSSQSVQIGNSLNQPFLNLSNLKFQKKTNSILDTMHTNTKNPVTYNDHVTNVQSKVPYNDLHTYTNRKDEDGEEIELANIKISYASYIGPGHAQKSENQDAAYIKQFQNGFMFALADGVGTSMGSRMAAAIAVKEFCDFGAEIFEKKNNNKAFDDLLYDSVEYAHQKLNDILNSFQERVDAPEFASLRGSIQPEVAIRLCQNTLNPTRRHWGSVLSTTLIGGVILKVEDNRYLTKIIRIGDGIVEHYLNGHSKGDIVSYFEMDENEMIITSSLCPGPTGEASIKKAELSQAINLVPGCSLLISSDGLKRGHHQAVWEKLSEIISNFRYIHPHLLLKKVSDYADHICKDDKCPQKLFGDNLSLILITIKETHE